VGALAVALISPEGIRAGQGRPPSKVIAAWMPRRQPSQPSNTSIKSKNTKINNTKMINLTYKKHKRKIKIYNIIIGLRQKEKT